MIVVFGSLNVDFVTMVPALPAPGETVLGPTFDLHPGGKGANRALAAARAGARTIMVGAVGRDALAATALALLEEAGIDLAPVRPVDAATGAAFITIDTHGANQIVVAAGANALAQATQMADLCLAPRDILLLQCETAAPENLAAARRAKAAGARVILNLAPARMPEAELLECVDILVVNEHEAVVLATGLGWPERDPDTICARADRELGLCSVATLGAAGVVGWRDGVRRAMPAPAVTVVDTTAAGDAFIGAFAAALDRGLGFSSALQHGLAAGSLACTRAGAQPSLPYLAATEALIGNSFM